MNMFRLRLLLAIRVISRLNGIKLSLRVKIRRVSLIVEHVFRKDEVLVRFRYAAQ